jgi:hypothetical protein
MSQPVGYRAGHTAFPKGKDGIQITFSAPMPNDDYAIVVQPTNTGGFSPTAEGTYFNVLRKTKDGFQVQHKTTEDNQPKKLKESVNLNWIAWTYN